VRIEEDVQGNGIDRLAVAQVDDELGRTQGERLTHESLEAKGGVSVQHLCDDDLN
jgi:hypothetical protein